MKEDDRLIRDDRGAAKPPTRLPPEANQPFTPPLRRIGRQQSVRWGARRHTRTQDQGWKGARRGCVSLLTSRQPSRIAADSNDDSNSSDQRQAATTGNSA
jgi:hypothetical protein